MKILKVVFHSEYDFFGDCLKYLGFAFISL